MIQTLFGSSDEKPSFLERMKQAVTRTRESLNERIDDLASIGKEIDRSTLDQHREQRALAAARRGEDAHALALAAGQRGVERAYAERQRLVDQAAFQRIGRVGIRQRRQRQDEHDDGQRKADSEDSVSHWLTRYSQSMLGVKPFLLRFPSESQTQEPSARGL